MHKREKEHTEAQLSFSAVADIVSNPNPDQYHRGWDAAKKWLRYMEVCTPAETLEWMARGLAQYFAAFDRIGGELVRETQATVGIWVRKRFPSFSGALNRATSVLEESVELGIASGLTPAQIRKAVEVVLHKQAGRDDIGDMKEEAADVLLTLYAFAHDGVISLDDELRRKMDLNRSRPQSYYDAKVAQKIGLGMELVPVEPVPSDEPEFSLSNPPPPVPCFCRCHNDVSANKSYGGWFCRLCRNMHQRPGR